MTGKTLYTIGHSTHPVDTFVTLLRSHDIEAVADIRSSPYSRYNPQYNRETLKKSLLSSDIAYVFLGDELGARRREAECYRNDKVDFKLVQELPLFLSGIDRLLKGSEKMRIAIMCAEKDPLHCHRTFLVSDYLAARDLDIQHILAEGDLVKHDDLLHEQGPANSTGDLFD